MQREYKGYMIKLSYDENAFNPREECTVAKFAFYHKRYNMPKEHGTEETFETLQELRDYILENFDVLVIEEIHMYEHGGCALYVKGEYPFACHFDSGPLGFIFIEKGIVENDDIEIANKFLRGELKTYERYLNRHVYRYTTSRGDEYIDSCCGFYSQEDAYLFATEEIDAMISNESVIKPSTPRMYTFRYMMLKDGIEFVEEIPDNDKQLFISLINTMTNAPKCSRVTFTIAGVSDDILMVLFSHDEGSFVVVRDEYSGISSVHVKEC